MLDKIIIYSFYTLLTVTPLIWYPSNFELFEFNKMIFVYLLTIIITGAWVLKIIQSKTLIFNRTPLDIPILLFLLSQVLSTAFSIDHHTSIFGYYSRSNGGLLSIISYILLFYAFVSNIKKEGAIKALKLAVFGGLAVALYAIPERFGLSPSCLILRGEIGTSCWVQDVQSRVFATLGQPNWLAAYLGMLIFPTIYFFLTAQNKRQRILYYLSLIAYYLAFTFTYSRGAMVGFLTGMVVFIPLLFKKPELKNITVIIFITFILVNLFFGSAITRFQLTQLLPKNDTPASDSKPQSSGSVTQLESGGTESGQIRLIVWKGALDIFKAYPIFGSGVETFAYSYYNFRPIEHNLVSEWDFLYNKAHNEYLNYLATTGAVGLGAYSIMIITFIIFILKKQQFKNLLLLSLLAGYISYLVQNFFGFSVVIIAVLFYLFPAFAFVLSDSIKPIKKLSINWFYRRSFYTKTAQGFVLLVTGYLLFVVLTMWLADIYFAIGQRNNEAGNTGRAYHNLSVAASLNPKEPLYINELGYAAAASAVALEETDATLSANLQEEAETETERSLKISPRNISFYRTAIRTYYQLTNLDSKFYDETIQMVNQAISLAPTDPKLYYNKALILDSVNQTNESMIILKKALELKPNYLEVKTQLEEATKSAE